MITIHLDESSSKAKALLAYLQTLDFIKVDQDDFSLTDEQIKELDKRRADHLSGKSKSHTWDEVKSFARKTNK